VKRRHRHRVADVVARGRASRDVRDDLSAETKAHRRVLHRRRSHRRSNRSNRVQNPRRAENRAILFPASPLAPRLRVENARADVVEIRRRRDESATRESVATAPNERLPGSDGGV